jgi:hypothetical protein
METEAAPNGRPRLLIGVLALVVVIAAIWVTAALAGGGSSSSGGSERNESPAASFVQDRGQAPRDEDCPEHRRQQEDTSDVSANL